jgi:hypothetical protein
MRRLVNRGLRTLWRSTEDLRRPILFKLETFLKRCIYSAYANLFSEADVLMDQVVRELIRLQSQVEALQQTILERLPAPVEVEVETEVPGIAGEIEPDEVPDQHNQLRAG